MYALLDHVAAILGRQAAPALSVDELLSHLRADVPGVVPTAVDLVRLLERDRARFAVLKAGAGARFLGTVLDRLDPDGPRPASTGPWVLCADAGAGPRGGRTQTLVRETMAHLGHGVDGQSARAVARWLDLLRECERAGARLGSGRSAA